jgi:aminoglycoside phosphotransferase (APT) family kinase protein
MGGALSPPDTSLDLRGVDLRALTAWLDAEHPGLRRGGLSGEKLAGGRSNLTYRITDGHSSWALRRPPLAHVLPTAHDMRREYRAISALAGTVPVPAAVALCEDRNVMGAPFYLMSFVDGVVLSQPDVMQRVTPDEAALCCDLLVDTLAALHGVEYASVGLADFGRPDGFLARQVTRWHKQWRDSATRDLDELDQAVQQLAATTPEQAGSAIVHGDYRLTNLMFGPALDRVAAVVDWEMATLGDPLTDLGMLVVYQTLAQQGAALVPQMPADHGFRSPEDLVARYAARSTCRLNDLPWYIALGYFKLAVAAEGIHRRYLSGTTVGDGFEHFGPAVPMLLQAALDELGRR